MLTNTFRLKLLGLIYIYVFLFGSVSWAQFAPGILPAPGATGLPQRPATVSTLSTIGFAQQPLVMQSGYCPAGYLPQYCGLNNGLNYGYGYGNGYGWGGACTPATPAYQCIQQARTMGAYAASGCALGDSNCMMQQQMMGCPPGLLGGNCQQMYYQNMMYYQQMQQQQMMQGMMVGMMAAAMMRSMMGRGGLGGPGGMMGRGPAMSPSSAPVGGGGWGGASGGDGTVGDCSKPMDPQAEQKFETCIGQMQAVSAAKSIIVDADTNTAWVVNTRNSSNSPQCYAIGVGGTSHGGSGSASLGNAYHQNQTPSGMLLTFNKKDSSVFRDPSEYCGLQGTNTADNGNTAGRGVLLHACNGEPYTEGCICFHNNWPQIKSLLQSQNNQNGTPVFVYSKNMTNSGCPNGNGGHGGGGGNGDSSAIPEAAPPDGGG